MSYLKETASREIQQIASSATREIQQAQAKVDTAQQDVNRLNDLIRQRRAAIEAERARAQEKLRKAEREVDSARNSSTACKIKLIAGKMKSSDCGIKSAVPEFLVVESVFPMLLPWLKPRN